MSAELIGANSHNLYYAGSILSGMPLTLSIWFYPTTVATNQTLMWLGDENIGLSYWQLGISTSSLLRFLTAQPSGASESRSVATSFALSEWHHGAVIFTSSTVRKVLLDGMYSQLGAGTDITPNTPNRLVLGGNGYSNNYYYTGRLAEVAIWNVALTDEEVTLLSKGFSPLFVRPDALIFYCPIFAPGSYQDWVGSKTLLAGGTGSIALAQHPATFHRSPVASFFPPSIETVSDFTYNPLGGVVVSAEAMVAFESTDIVWGYSTLGWDRWKRADGSPATYDAIYGRLLLQPSEVFYSEVCDVGTESKRLQIVTNRYGEEGSGSGTIEWRGSDTLFSWDDELPTWEIYTYGIKTWRYIQIRVSVAAEEG